MTTQFDPNATPVCDKFQNEINRTIPIGVGWMVIAREQEIASRIAEEKLRIAKKYLDAVKTRFQGKEGNDFTFLALEAFQEIEKVGK